MFAFVVLLLLLSVAFVFVVPFSFQLLFPSDFAAVVSSATKPWLEHILYA